MIPVQFVFFFEQRENHNCPALGAWTVRNSELAGDGMDGSITDSRIALAARLTTFPVLSGPCDFIQFIGLAGSLAMPIMPWSR